MTNQFCREVRPPRDQSQQNDEDHVQWQGADWSLDHVVFELVQSVLVVVQSPTVRIQAGCDNWRAVPQGLG